MADDLSQELNTRILEELVKVKDQESPDMRPIQSSFSSRQVVHVLAPYLFKRHVAALSSRSALCILKNLIGIDHSAVCLASEAVLKEWNRATVSTASTLHMTDEFLVLLVAQLLSPDTVVAENATDTLLLASQYLGPKFVRSVAQKLKVAGQQAWEGMASSGNTRNRTSSSTSCIRCASAAAAIAVLDDTYMKIMIEVGVPDMWKSFVEYEEDPLLRLSALDIMGSLVSTQPPHPARTQWLLHEGPLETLLRLAGATDEPDPILGPTALRIVATHCCLLDSRQSAVIPSLFKSFNHALRQWPSSGELDRLALVNAISHLAGSLEVGLLQILQDEETMKAWLWLGTAQPKLKAAILVSVAQVIDPTHRTAVPVHEPPSTAAVTKLWMALGKVNSHEHSASLLLSTVRSPLTEVRMGVYCVWESLAKRATTAILLQTPEFLPVLLTRELEPSTPGKVAKFAVVEALLQSTQTILQEDREKLERYQSEGAFYQLAQSWEIATE